MNLKGEYNKKHYKKGVMKAILPREHLADHDTSLGRDSLGSTGHERGLQPATQPVGAPLY